MKLAKMPVFWMFLVAAACALLSAWNWPDSHIAFKWMWSAGIIGFSIPIIGAMNE